MPFLRPFRAFPFSFCSLYGKRFDRPIKYPYAAHGERLDKRKVCHGRTIPACICIY